MLQRAFARYENWPWNWLPCGSPWQAGTERMVEGKPEGADPSENGKEVERVSIGNHFVEVCCKGEYK